jgi:hypothetical protein
LKVKVFTAKQIVSELADRSPNPDEQWEDNREIEQGWFDLSQALKALAQSIVNRKIIFCYRSGMGELGLKGQVDSAVKKERVADDARHPFVPVCFYAIRSCT